jgi:hypothetical protein
MFFHIKHTAPFFYTSSAKIFIVALPPFKTSNFWLQLIAYPSDFFDFPFFNNGKSIIFLGQMFFLVERFAWFLFFVIGIFSPIFFLREKRLFAIFICNSLCIIYFAVLTGPVANERYRLPAVPFCALNVVHFIAKISKKKPLENAHISGIMDGNEIL